jgi:Cu/Ag efflux protein CusF
MTRTFTLLLLALALLVVGCHKKEEAKRYPMQGEIKALDATAKTATIAAGKIGDWMEAMTMEYPVKDKQEFGKLKVGEKIQAKILVQGTDYWIASVNEEPAK